MYSQEDYFNLLVYTVLEDILNSLHVRFEENFTLYVSDTL